MKKYTVLLMAALLVLTALTGCRSNVPQDTTGSIAPSTTTPPTTTLAPDTTAPSDTQGGDVNGENQSLQTLQNIWDQYGEDERFSVYGGAVENAVNDAPGALDVSDAEEMTNRYLLPQEQLTAIQEGASLVHMMNSNIFTAVAVKLSDGADQKALSEAWQASIQGNQWICGQPDRLLIVDTGDGHMIMAFGSTDAIKLFSDKLTAAYAEAQKLFDEAIVS